ncbi:glycosyltransferase family 2 protein [Oricola cellulosilytica]|uniref:Glycosyltransferase n=1 Tax=Oricola cellulosilytica TaxID=1429082 RepID=A0A4R0PHS0_9HYPH|nr:glycosyltransferase [Oricola cellulosilytica]TCD16568.1 glycosyltransferase [Oricola cellulosilytica]
MKQRLADNISLAGQTPGLDAAAVEIAVTVPTFRRPDHLLRTLDSLRAQKTSRPFAVIVMENDAEGGAGAEAAAPRFQSGADNGLVVIAHERGNCHAYNAGWFTAFTLFPNLRYLAVIDDDEIADPNWIEQLCATSERLDCALVGGPQIAVFEGDVRGDWQTHPVFTPHHNETGPVPVIYSSGNLLVRSDVLRAMPQPFLDPRFNFTGGGDSDFIQRARTKGFRIAWCNEAIVRETVPERRVTWSWIQARSLRNGMLSAAIEHRRRAGDVFGRTRTIAKSLALLAAAPPRFAVRFASTGSLLPSLYPVHVALGRIMSEFGYANEQYRDPEKN